MGNQGFEVLLAKLAEAFDLPPLPASYHNRLRALLRRSTPEEAYILVCLRSLTWPGTGSPWAWITRETDATIDFLHRLGRLPVGEVGLKDLTMLYSFFIVCHRLGLADEFVYRLLSLKSNLDALLADWPTYQRTKDVMARESVDAELARLDTMVA